MSDTTPQWQKKSDALLRIHDENLKSGYYTDEYMAEQMSPEEAERIRDIRYRMGIEREPDSGFWGELSDETALSLNRGVRNMLKFVDADNAVESLDRVLARNQQWIPPEKRSVSGAVGGMIGSGVGSTVATLPGMVAGAVAGSAIGGPAGTVVGFALPFMNTFAMQYEDVKQRNLDNGMDNGSATAEAVVETAMLSAVETMLGTVPGIGKLLKGKPTAGIAARALNKLTGKMGGKAATRFVTNTVKGVLGNAAEEGAEEAVQYLIGVAGESFSEYIGRDADFFNRLRENFSAKELGENALAGFVAGGALGVPGAVSDASRTNARIKFFGDYRENPSRYTRWFDEQGNKLIIPGKNTGVSPEASAGVAGAVDAQTAAETAPERTLAALPSGLTVARNDAEAEIIDRYDNASDSALRSEAARLNLPDINPASDDTTMLRQALTEHRLAELRSAPAVSETAPESAAVSTPVTADNSISRESIAPAENLPSVPVAPETPVAVEQTVPSAPVQSPPAVPQPSGNILSYMDDSMVEYTPETPSAPVAPVDTTSGAVAGIAPSAPSVPSAPRENSEIRERDIDAVAEYENAGVPGELYYAPQRNITDKETRRSSALSQKIYRALDMGKVVNVVSEESTGITGASTVVPRRNIINLTEARTPLQYFHAAMHELTHSLIMRNKAAYNKLLEQILPLVMGKEQFESKLETYINSRKDITAARIGKAGAMEEFVCDMVADLMQTRHFWEVLSQQDMPLAVRLLAAVKKFADKISGTLDSNSELDVIFGENLNDVIRIAAEFVTDDGKARPQSTAEVASQAEVVSAENAPATETAPSESVQTGQSSAFTMKDGESLKNDSGKAVLVYHEKPPKGALWGNKKFKSENLYGTAQYAIVGNDVHIRFTNSSKTGKKYLFFTIPDFRDQTISEIRQAVQKIDPDSTYPLGRNFDDLLNDLHDHGMRVYPSSLKPLAPAAQTSGNRKEETAVPEKGTPKENSEVAPAEKAVSKNEQVIPDKIDSDSSEKEIISFLENHYDRIGDNTKETVFRKLVDYLKESPLHLKAIPQKTKVKSKKLLDALFPFANNKDARAAYTVVKVTDKEMTATDGKILVVAQNTSGVEPGAYSLKKRQIVKEEISKYPDLSIITSKKYTDSTNADSLLTDGRVNGAVDIYNKLLGDGFFGGTVPVILKFGKSSIQVDATNLKKVLDLFKNQEIENITISSSTQETKFNSERIVINNIIRIQGGNISAYIIGLNPDKIGGGGGIAQITLDEKTETSDQSEQSGMSDQSVPVRTAPSESVEQVEIIPLDNVDKITDEDFNNPKRSIILPSLPQKLLDLINKKSKPVLLKKNILEKNKNNHPELSAEDNRKILDAALYHAELIGQSQPDKRPNYWVAVKLDSAKNAVVVFDVQETKTHHEIVGWHFANEKGLKNLQKQAAREGGQILDMRNKSQSPSDQAGTGNNDNIEDIPEKSSTDSENTLQKMRDAFENRAEILNSTSKQMLWTDIAREYADGQVLAKEANNAVLQEIIDMCLDDYQNSETDNILNAIAGNSSFNENIRKKAKSAIKTVENKRADDAIQSAKQVSSTISKITSAPAGSRERIMAFTELPDGEHTVNGTSFTKKDNAFTFDGKTLNAREIEKATRTTSEKMRKTVEESVSDAESGYTPKTEAKPKKEPTLSDKMRGKGKKSSTPEVSEKSDKSTAEKIEDYGEKIGGAKKDIIRRYADKINLNGATFAKMFPKPDYAKLLEAGIKIDVLAKLKTAYDMAKAGVKRHKTLEGKQDLNVAKFYAVYAKNALIGEESVDMAEAGYVFTDYGKRTVIIRSQAMEQLLKELGAEYANVDLSYFDIADTWENGKKPELPEWASKNRDEDWQKRYRVRTYHASKTGFFDNVEDAIKYYIEIVKKHTTVDQPKYKILTDKAMSGEHKGEYYLKTKIRGFGEVTLQYFKSLEEAWKYRDEHADDLQHQAAEIEEQKKAERKSKFTGKNQPLRLRFNSETLRDRVGIDYRNGKDVSAKEFAERFNFRAVEFGNSVSQKERQTALNALYDSLMDMANALDISPEAISLNGKLAFAYGARGSGNAEAHYEPEKNVINLTRTRGAGNVAHEWWHALDYYFADSKTTPATDGKFRSGIRDEVKNIFQKLNILFTGDSPYVTRAERLDAFTKKNYYTLPTEMAARAFGDYISRILESRGQVNDFLNSSVSETDWKGEENTYPYPTGEDAVKIDDTLQSLFNTLDEKTDESGNRVLFSMVGDRGASRMDNSETLLDNLRIAKEMTGKGEDAKTIKLATGWEKGKDGKWRMEIPDLKWKTEATLPDGIKYERTPFDMIWTSGKLGDYVNAPELFQAYPELKNIKLDFSELPWAQDAYFDEVGNKIVINNEKLRPVAESIDYIKDQKGKESRRQELVEIIEDILIHEVQHAVQQIEGFAKGGSLEADKKISSEARHNARANSLRKHLADAGFEVSKAEAMLLTDENANDTELEKLWDKLVAKGMTEEKYNKIFQKIPLFIGYNNLAGEVESRNAVTRSRMSMEERRQSLLDETADVAPEDRIYLMENAGVSELAIGDKFSQIKDSLQQEEGQTPLFAEKYNSVTSILPKLAEIFNKFPNDITAADGATVLIKNTDNGKISERLKHLISQKDSNSGERNTFGIDNKIPWLPRIVETLENAQVKLKDPQTGNYAYARAYKDGVIHTVIVSKNGIIQGQETFDHGLITQFAERFTGRRESFEVVWERKASKQKSSPQTASHMESPGKFPRPFRQDKYTPDSQEVNPASAKNPENSLSTTLTPEEIAELENNEQLAEEVGNGIKFSLVTDKKIIDKLDAEEKSGDYLTLYRSVQIGPDGKLHSPMAAKIAGKWGPEIKLGVWEQADERPELSKAKIAKDGKIKYLFDLNKGNGKTIGGVLYNPYIHSSNVMLNDQFSEAYQRPELVTVEVHVPESELTSGYKAKRANDAVGMKDWKAGVVQSKLTGKRKVMLSRWDKPVRIVPDSEVAQHIKELIAGKDIAIPANVVTPSLRAELEKIGVEIDYSVKEYVPERERTAQPELKLSLTSDRKTAQKESLLTQVKTLFEAKEPVVDKKWVMTNRQVYQTLYRYVFPTAEFVKDMPSQREMEILNMVIESGDMSGAALVAEPYFNDEDLQLKKDFDSKRNSALDEVLDKVTAPVGKTIRKYLRNSNAKKDLSLIELALRTPMWIAKKLKDVPVVQAIYNAARMFSDDKARIYEYLRGDVIARLDAVYKADKKEYKKFAEYLFECDRNQTGAGKVRADRSSGKFIALTADNEKIGEYDTEAEAWDALFKKEREQLIAQGYSTAAGDALYEIRKQNYSTYLFIFNNTLRSLRQLGLINAKSTSFIITDASKFFPELEREENTGDIDLFELMREMGQRSGYYMPRKRKPGKYQLWAFKAGQPTIMETFDTAMGRAIRKRELEKSGYRTENRLSDAPNQDMMAQVNPAALMDIINQAAQRSRDFIRKEITFATIDYTKKDGSTEKHLVVDGKNLPREISETLKSLGGRWIDNQWHFIKPDADTQQNITEILESEMQNRLKMTSLMQTSIMENLRDMIRENSSASFKISRRKAVGNDVVRGYFEDPMKALALYYSGIAGGTARNVMAKKMYSAYGGMDFDREQFVADLIPENLEVNSDAYNRAKLNAINEYYREVRRRALDSSKQPNIANYMSKYIQDMLRNTDGLERVVGAVKGFAAVYMLGKPVSALNNLAGAQTIVPAVISQETGRNVFFAAKDFTVGVTKYINYALYNKSGIGAAPSGIDKTIFDIIHENHWDNSEFAREATTAGMTYMGKAAHQMSNVALYLFGGVEQANRAASIRAAAIALAKKKGIELSKLSRKELFDLLDESRAISDLANGVYDKSNKISVARGGGLHTIADAFMLFRTYEANLFQVYIDLIKNRNYGALAYTSAMLTLIGGVSGSIAMSMLSSLLGFMGFGDDDEDKDYDERFFSLVSDKFGERSELILRYGLPSLVDINLSGTFQNTVTRMMKEKSIKPALIWTATPAMFWVDRGKNIWHYGTTGQTLKALEQLLPAGIGGIVSPSGILRAIDESIHGVTDRNARVRKDIYDRNIEPDWLAITMRSLGFNPVSISEKTERLWSEKKIRNRYSEKRRKIYTRYREYMNSGSNDTAVLADITADIDDYNARVTRSRRNIPLIDEEGLERAVKERENKFFKDSDEE